MADKTIPLCKDCKHFSDGRGEFRSRCLRVMNTQAVDLVRGEPKAGFSKSPWDERSSNMTWFGKARCGPEGRFFEAIKRPPTYEEQLKGFKELSEMLAALDAKSTADLVHGYDHNFAPPVCGSRASIPLKSTSRFRALFDESIAEQNRRNAEEQLAANKPGGDLAYGMAEGTIERYSRYAQEMQQIRKDEWED